MRVWVEPSALDEIAALPGHMRQRIRRCVSDLREVPRPAYSRALAIPEELLAGADDHRVDLEVEGFASLPMP